jgi:chromosome segregation ATPase
LKTLKEKVNLFEISLDEKDKKIFELNNQIEQKTNKIKSLLIEKDNLICNLDNNKNKYSNLDNKLSYAQNEFELVISDYLEYRKAHNTKEFVMQDEIKKYNNKLVMLTDENQKLNQIINDIEYDKKCLEENYMKENDILKDDLENLNLK